MNQTDEEEKRLRSVALQNAQAILLARQRAERELLEAKETLERKTGELAHSLAMMHATLESSTDGILATNAEGAVTNFNQNFVEMWRIPAEIVASGKHAQLMEWTSALFAVPEPFRARLEEIYASSPPETYDLLELSDGRMIERFSKTQWVDQRNVGRVWSYRDITERIRAERGLREQSEWFRVTLGSIGDAVITVDTSRRITFLNPIAEALTGWTSAEAVGQPVHHVMQLVDEETREKRTNPIDLALEQGIVLGLGNHTLLIRQDRSELPIEDSAAPIKDPGGAIIGAVMVFHDVTERRQREIALESSYEAEQKARAVAEHANKAKDQFLAALSHELRTPLTPVLAILSSHREEETIPEELAEDLETVRRNVELEARLIDDLLDLTRVTSGKLHLRHEYASASRIIEDAVNTCLPDLKAKRLTLQRELVEPPPMLYLDSTRVVQILWNLLKNSIKFTPADGTITIRARVTGEADDQQLVIEVQDTGLGMERGDLERLFQPFEQADRSIARQFGGLGLGLTISKAIAEAHRGKLHAASDGKGQGSVFTLTLPCPRVEDIPTPNPRAQPAIVSANLQVSGGEPQRQPRILLVEDHADTAAIFSRLLRRMGYHVVHADSIASAREIADREMRGEGIDLVISDLGLPDGTGQDLMRVLSATHRLKGIALSGYGMDSDLEQSSAAGFSRHLVKPIDIKVLQSTVAELLKPEV